MNTINAQTIINEAMAALAVAPDKTGSDFFDKIKIKTSERGHQLVQNNKSNIQKFIDLVRKNAAAFGGGLVRMAKPRPSVSWPANLVALFKQSIEDHDYRAALDIGDRLGALFYTSSKGNVFMQVAPVPCDFNDRVVSVCNEDGKFSVIDPVSMRALTGLSFVQKRTRAAQVENVRLKLESMPSFDLNAAIDKQSAFAADQSILRAQWILEHGMDSEAIETRIDAHNAQIEEQASQDVAQVVAQALATIAITEAMADTSEDARELVTCEAGESEASAPTAGQASWAPVPQYVPPSLSQVKPGEPVPPAYRGGMDDIDPPSDGNAEPTTRPVESQPEAAAPAVETAQDAPDTLESFDDSSEGISNELIAAIESATVDQVQALTDAQFSKLYDHLENWNFHTENYFLQALRLGDAGIVADMRQVMADQNEAGYLRGDIYDRRMAIAARMRAIKQAKDVPAVDVNEWGPAIGERYIGAVEYAVQEANRRGDGFEYRTGENALMERRKLPAVTQVSECTPCQTVKSKSEKWAALLFMDAGLFAMVFNMPNKPGRTQRFNTASERMAALQAMARAADAPTDTPPGGGLPCPAEAPTTPVATSTPGTPVAVSSAPKTTKARNGRMVLAKEYHGELYPMTYANRAQAYAAAEKHGGVVLAGHPFLVALDVKESEPTTTPAVSSAPAKPKIADIRQVIETCDWKRNDLGGATVNEFKAMNVPAMLTPHIDAVKALEIPPRFTKDIERQAWAIECAQRAIARWQAKQ